MWLRSRNDLTADWLQLFMEVPHQQGLMSHICWDGWCSASCVNIAVECAEHYSSPTPYVFSSMNC